MVGFLATFSLANRSAPVIPVPLHLSEREHISSTALLESLRFPPVLIEICLEPHLLYNRYRFPALTNHDTFSCSLLLACFAPPRPFPNPHISAAWGAVVAGADLVGERDGHGHFRVPRVVRGLVGTHIVSVHCGSNFTLAVDRAGVTHRCERVDEGIGEG